MKYFLDTEFIEYPCTIDLISIGIVAEDGREFYAINKECDFSKASPWVKDNIISKLPKIKTDIYSLGEGVRGIGVKEVYCPPEYMTKNVIASSILKFIGNDKPEFWGWYADYDWVVFCWLFGTMMELPKGWPMYCRDLKQLVDQMPFKTIFPKPKNDNHNALEDAHTLKERFDYIKNLKTSA